MFDGLRLASKCSVAVALLVATAACQSTLPKLPGLSGERAAPELALLGGDVTVKGPSGYCVDTGISRPRNGLAVMAACSTLSGEGTVPWRNAIIVVQAGEAGSSAVTGAEASLRDLLDSPAGKSLLSTTNDAETITLRRTSAGRGLVSVAFVDSGPVPMPGVANAEWRGFMDFDDRLVTLSLRGLADDPLSPADGASLLREAVAALRSANADPS